MIIVKWIGIAVLTVGALVAIVALIGLALPQDHVASRTVVLKRPVEDVWATINDVQAFPAWRSSVTRVEVLEQQPLRWREIGKDGTLTFQVTESRAPSRLVSEITDKSLPFGGTWTYELRPVEGGTELRITEAGEVYNPIFRFVSRFVLGHTATMDAYLAGLEKRLSGGTKTGQP